MTGRQEEVVPATAPRADREKAVRTKAINDKCLIRLPAGPPAQTTGCRVGLPLVFRIGFFLPIDFFPIRQRAPRELSAM